MAMMGSMLLSLRPFLTTIFFLTLTVLKVSASSSVIFYNKCQHPVP